MTDTKPPKVSVLVTSYNRERYLAESIESVLGQTLGDFELIITDNCSSDRSAEIARRYEQQDARIRVVVNDSNIGQFGNRNLAASLARGTFLKYHDSDDLMYPHCLDTMVRALESEPRAGFALSRGNYWLGGPTPMFLTPRMCYQREFIGTRMFMCGPSGALFRTEVFRELGGFADEGAPSDYIFWLRACARVPVVLAPADLFWYRVHPDQELQQPHVTKQYARAATRAWEALHAPECPLTPEEREIAIRNHAFDVVREAYRSARRGDVPMAFYRLAHAGLSVADFLRYLRWPRRDYMAGTPFDSQGDYGVTPWAVRS
jgi:hypothetical protein